MWRNVQLSPTSFTAATPTGQLTVLYTGFVYDDVFYGHARRLGGSQWTSFDIPFTAFLELLAKEPTWRSS